MDRLSLADIYHGTNERAIAIRGLLFTIVLTPVLLLPTPAREIVSSEAIAVAVGCGAVTGIVLSVCLEGVRIDADRSDVTVAIATLVSTGVATVLVWILLPREHLSTFTQFAIVFSWSFSLTSATRHIVWPAVFGSAGARD
ncbi:hypothetical protein [Natronorubrum halophilum]|uniref:hypothetical protein n=1 Tax=Natronorubrum halophilum TaxID=1702106 RepID=UPI0010C22242|nr:hypothetical protein [Natronorubrum halophilum]